MEPIENLINEQDSGWTFVKQWISDAKNKVEILPVNLENAKTTLYKIQVTTRSPMGAIIYETGGILIDDGWIRILGSGSEKLPRNIADWNIGKGVPKIGEKPTFFLIADDAIGGFFVLNMGEFGNDLGKVYYFAPDSLDFEPLDLSYSEFINFCFDNNLDELYKGLRWKNWREDTSKLNGDKVFNFYPFLWTKEGKNIENDSRKAISVEEQYHLNIDFKKQLSK